MKKKYAIILMIFFLIFFIKYLLSFRTLTFKEVTGLTNDNVEKVLIGDKLIYDDYDELLKSFDLNKYKRSFKNNFDFEREFPDGIKTYMIIIYSIDGDITTINPLGNKVVINNRLYIVEKKIDHKSLIDFYESLDESSIIRN